MMNTVLITIANRPLITKQGTGGKGTLTSATLFKSPSEKPYVLCTTSPSSERGRTGEWSFISPTPLGPVSVPIQTQHTIQPLHSSVLVGAATSVGDLIAVLEASGTVRLFAVESGRDGGLRCRTFQHPVLKFDTKLSRQESAPPTSLRFQETMRALHLFAVDLHGKLIVKTVMKGAYPPLITRIPTGIFELGHFPPTLELHSESLNPDAPPSDAQPTGTSTTRTQAHGEPRYVAFRRTSLP
jgi:hypothetical protein